MGLAKLQHLSCQSIRRRKILLHYGMYSVMSQSHAFNVSDRIDIAMLCNLVPYLQQPSMDCSACVRSHHSPEHPCEQLCKL